MQSDSSLKVVDKALVNMFEELYIRKSNYGAGVFKVGQIRK